MDNSFSKENTTDKKSTFLHDATHLHERQEVHEKGIFHANYGGKGFFGSIGQFFKNIKLSFEKNDIKELKNALNTEYTKYRDAYTAASRIISEDKGKQRLRKDVSKIENFLRSMIVKGSIKDSSHLPDNHLVLSVANQFASMGKEINKTINSQNK